MNLYKNFLASSTIILFGASFAQGAGGIPILAGSDYAKPGGVISVSTVLTFAINLDARRSYACTAVGQNSDTNTGFSASVTGPGGTTQTGVLQGEVTPAVPGNSDTDLKNNRLVFTAQSSGTHSIQLTDFKSGGESVRIECVETSLYGVYNTNVNDFNFLELTNTTNTPLSGSWTATNWDGQEFTGDFSIPANRRVDINLHDVVGQDRFGQVLVSHSGPDGALLGYVSQYVGTPTNFSLAASNRLIERER